jgi:two-component system, chemotaxis family, response regulator Rcp1
VTVTAPRPLKVLLVEDSEEDVMLIRVALNEQLGDHELMVIGNGDAAVAYLNAEPPHPESPLPDLVLLDLNLPGTDGRGVLQAIKSSRTLHATPVVIMTTSGAEDDITAAYALNANAYVQKPIQLDDFISAVRSIKAFWVAHVRFAEHEA